MQNPLSEHGSDHDKPRSTDADLTPTSYLDDDEFGAYDTNVSRAVTINRPREELYAFWRDFRNFQRFMENVKSIEVLESGRSRWVIAGPGDKDVEFTSTIVEDIPGRRIAWRADEEADVKNEGWVEFSDGPTGRGTEVRVFISYDPPMGALGKIVAKVMQREPNIQLRRDLRRFKQLVETGEIPTSEAGPAAPRSTPKKYGDK